MEKDQKKLFYGDTKHTNLESLNNSVASIFSSQNYHKMFCILYFWADQNGEKTLSNLSKGESAHNLALSHDFALLLKSKQSKKTHFGFWMVTKENIDTAD